MDEIFGYIDDILIFSKSWETHLHHVEIQRLQSHGLKASLEKTDWGVLQVPYLGYVLSKNNMRMDGSKVQDILKIPIPVKLKDKTLRPKALRKAIRQFLGATGFYRTFIKDYAELAAPLSSLTKTTVQPHWTSAHTMAWEKLKAEMAKEPVLIQPDEASHLC
jgi:hypothetical protein